MEEDLECNTGLGLGLGGNFTSKGRRRIDDKSPVQLNLLFPSRVNGEYEEPIRSRIKEEEDKDEGLKEGISVDEGGGGTRKKLRLSKEQWTVLEESFRVHTTLNQYQKQELAERLNLQPRQVEVWFQNKRARTKLKKTEEDYEFLKKCCERLSDENRRLKRELKELKSSSSLSIHHHHHHQRSIRICPSCESITTDDNESS